MTQTCLLTLLSIPIDAVRSLEKPDVTFGMFNHLTKEKLLVWRNIFPARQEVEAYSGHLPRSLHQAEQSAGLVQRHHRHVANCLLHWFHLSDLPAWGHLTTWPTPVTLCTAPMEQAESDEQAEARPHPCGASCLLLSAGVREGGDVIERREELRKGRERKGNRERRWHSDATYRTDRSLQKVKNVLDPNIPLNCNHVSLK